MQAIIQLIQDFFLKAIVYLVMGQTQE